jgi:hypothetical protein
MKKLFLPVFHRLSAKLVTITCLLALAGCATVPKSEDNLSTKIDPADSKDFKLELKAAQSQSGTLDYKFKQQGFKAHWISCETGPRQPFVLLFTAQEAKEPKPFCNSWMAQAVLNSGFNVVTVNQPGHGLSTGSDDFGGPQSVTSVVTVVDSALKGRHLIGAWGVAEGTITAAFSAKSLNRLKWLILGNGFYDLEAIETHTKSDAIKSLIEKLKRQEGDQALEQRSIAWDTSKLPLRIAMYHSRDNNIAPKAQAEALNDQLRTLQTKVSYDDIEGAGHDIPWQSHYKLITKILSTLPK